MKLDPEERIIAAALDQAVLDEANERGAGAWIEFSREGHAKATITISHELVAKAMTLDWSTGGTFRGGCPNIAPGGVRDRGPGQGGRPPPPSKLIPPAASRRTTLFKRAVE